MPKNTVVSSERPLGVTLISLIGGFIFTIIMIRSFLDNYNLYHSRSGFGSMFSPIELVFAIYWLVSLFLLFRMKKAGYWMTMIASTLLCPILLVFILSFLILFFSLGFMDPKASSSNFFVVGIGAAVVLGLLTVLTIGALLFYLYKNRQLFK